MSSRENKTAERRLVAEVWNKHNSQAVEEFVAPDVVMHNAVLSLGEGREGYKRALEMVFAAFPDAQLTIDDLVADGDLVAERWTLHGTHQGEFMGMPPTNNRVTLTGIDIYRYSGGKRVEAWGYADVAGMMKQLRGG
jgi:steroid delta-isomerase-like uncharacterized protein